MKRFLGMIVLLTVGAWALWQWRASVLEMRRLHQEARKPVEVSVTIPEGFTLRQMEERFLAAGFSISIEDWEKEVGTKARRGAGGGVAALRPNGVDMEGYLFPDTYRFYADASAEDIIDTLERTWGQKVAQPLNAAREARGWTWHETLTRASLVQGEVRHQEDMRPVAGVIENRLRIGMALQLDSTVHYAVGRQDADVFTSAKERETDSPYNTYRVRGLPPGPINNPGLAAIEAVLNATRSTDLYFLTDPQGVAHFAQTLEQHVANKAKHW